MQAIILAAGRGSRMQEKTKNIPKALLGFKNKKLLDWQIDSLQNAGIKKIALVLGYKKNTFCNYNIPKFYNNSWRSTSIVVSLLAAKNWLMQDTCIICYSDIIYSAQIIKKLKNTKNDIVITNNIKWQELWQQRFDDPLVDAESFRIDNNNYLVEIGKRAKNINDIQGQYMGILKITPLGFKKIELFLNSLSKKTISKLDITSLLSLLIENGIKIKTIVTSEFWCEFDTQNDFFALS